MPEIRFLTSSDEHLADKPPGFRKDDYRGELFEILEWQGQQAKKLNTNAVIRAGDLFHNKIPSRTSMDTLATLAGIHRGYHCETISVGGNHDMSYNDLNTIYQQPLGVLYKSGVIGFVNKIYESGDFKVRVVGVDYVPDI